MEIIAHRGASHEAPENTLAAARLAWAQNADALELDVRLTRDGRLAVIHDHNTRRIAGTVLRVSKATLDELAGLDAGRWKNPQYTGEKIPALEEMLATVPAGKRAFIELKDGPEALPELERCVAHIGLAPAQVVIISFNLAVAQAVKQRMPAYETAWIVEHAPARGQRFTLDEVIGSAKAHGLDAIDLEAVWPVNAELVRHIHEAGLKLYVWTVDDPTIARRFARAGVDGLTTNRPGWLRDALAQDRNRSG